MSVNYSYSKNLVNTFLLNCLATGIDPEEKGYERFPLNFFFKFPPLSGMRPGYMDEPDFETVVSFVGKSVLLTPGWGERQVDKT